jgi:hypothetical protein
MKTKKTGKKKHQLAEEWHRYNLESVQKYNRITARQYDVPFYEKFI